MFKIQTGDVKDVMPPGIYEPVEEPPQPAVCERVIVDPQFDVGIDADTPTKLVVVFNKLGADFESLAGKAASFARNGEPQDVCADFENFRLRRDLLELGDPVHDQVN